MSGMQQPRPASAPPKSNAAGGGGAEALSANRLREYQQYTATHVQDTLQDMVVALFTETPLPPDPLSFMQDFLAAKKRSIADDSDSGKARELLTCRLNRAARQLDVQGLTQLVESAERQAAASSSPCAAGEALVTFTEPGSLGMKLNEHEGTGRALVVAINAGTQAEKHQPKLRPGLLIQRIGTTSVVDMPYKSVLRLLKAAGRPCTLAFAPLDEIRPRADIEALAASAKTAEAKALASRNAREGRQRRKGMSVVQGDGTPTQAEMEAALAATN